jgi:hypothetical protein
MPARRAPVLVALQGNRYAVPGRLGWDTTGKPKSIPAMLVIGSHESPPLSLL